MAVNFPDSPTDNQIFQTGGRSYKYNTTLGVWEVVSGASATDISELTDTTNVIPDDISELTDTTNVIPDDISDLTDTGGVLGGGGATVYADMASLIAATGMSAGDQALVTALNKVFMYTGSAWYLVATMVNDSPTAITGVDGSYALATDGTSTVITAVSTDPEGFPLTWSSSTSGLGSIATVGQGTGEGYAIASAAILSGTYAVTAYAGALTFKPDGTEMYYVFTNTDSVSRHTLSTAWDVSTASYVGSSPNTLSQVSNLTDVKFNNNGTKMYMADSGGTTDNTIYQYSLSTAWDPDTATYDNKSYDFSSVLTGDDLNCFVFNADGTAVYLAEHYPSSNIYQFTLSTAFDISTASYSNKNLSLTSIASNGFIGRQYFQFTNDGSKLFLIHTFHPAGFVGKIYEYSLTTAYDISTASHTSVSYTPSGITTGRSALAFKPDGSKMFIMGTDNHTTISQFNLPVYADNQFVITPSTTEADAGSFSITFSVTDGSTGAVNAVSAFTLTFAVDWTTASQQQKVQASDAASTGNFGRSVSVSDNTASILGIDGTYIFNRSGTTWSQQQKIQPSDHSTNKGPWGMYETDLDGETCVIGYKGGTETSLPHSKTGTAYVFTRSGTTWTQQQKLFNPNGLQYDYFGENMQLDGDNLIVSAHYEPHNTNSSWHNAGAVYIWTRSGTTWTQQQRLTASDKSGSDYFGAAVAIDGDTCVIGANGEDTEASNAGAAYVFTRSGTTWSQQQKLVASDAAVGDNFGTAIGISGDTVVVGANSENGGAGSVYVFTRSGTTWTQQQKLTGSDATASSDYFGKNVRIFEDTIMVTATGHTTFSAKGAAYIFTRSGTTWTQVKRLEASDGAQNDYNDEIDFSGGTIVMGANGSNTTASDAGAGYFFVGG